MSLPTPVKAVIFLSLSFLTFGCVQNNLGEAKEYFEYEANVADVQNSIVAIVALDADGEVTIPDCTGFFVGPRTVVTALHCIEGDGSRILNSGEGFLVQVNVDKGQEPILGKEMLFVTFEKHNNFIENYNNITSPKVNRSFVKSIDFENDLAVLELAPTEESSSHWLPIGREHIFAGNHVYSLGMPVGTPWILTEGIISSVKKFPSGKVEIIHQTGISPGSSGSPLLDDKGQVIGITIRKFIDAPYLGIATLIKYLDEMLKKSFEQTLIVQLTIDEYIEYILSQNSCDPTITNCPE